MARFLKLHFQDIDLFTHIGRMEVKLNHTFNYALANIVDGYTHSRHDCNCTVHLFDI